MCCGTPTTLYGTTTLTTSTTKLVPTTTTIKPYGTVSTAYFTTCTQYQGTSCLNSTVSTRVYTIDYFQTQTKTSTVTQVVPLTSTKTYPTATMSTPCPSKRDSEILEDFEKRGEGMPSINMGSKMGLAIVVLLLSSTIML